MSLFLDELIMLADIFDASGLHKEANAIDAILKEAAEIHDIIQRRVEEEAEKDECSPRVTQFMFDLEKALQEKVGDPTSKINYEIFEEIREIAQELLTANIYQTPGTGQTGLSMWYKAQNDIINLVDGIIELEDEISAKGAYEGEEIEEKDYASSFDKLQKLYAIVKRIKEGGRPKDKETYRLLRDYYNERRGKEIW